MGRALRIQPGEFESVELTWRCLQGRFLLHLGLEANRCMLGVIGQCMRLFEGDVRLYFAGGACNHIRIVAAFRSAEVKAAWTYHVRTNLSKELGDLYDWRGCHWERRSIDIPILDIAEARYPAPERVLEPPAVLWVKPHDWPEKSKRCAAPGVHASSRTQRLEWRAEYREFVETYRSAMKALRAGVEGGGLPPEGC